MADTLNLEAERAAYLAAFPDVHFSGAWTARNEQDFAVWIASAARRSTSSVSEVEMPELPKPKAPANEYFSDEPVYSADEVREIIAADRRARQGEPVKCVICGSDEPRQGSCGSDDPRALCNRAATKATAPADAKLAEQAEQTAILGSENQCRDLLLEIARWAPAEDAREEVLDDEAKSRAVIEHLGPAALTGGKMSVYDAFGLGFDAGAAHARRASSVPAIPGTGWKLVPITPTLEMVVAGDETLHGRGTCVLAWRAMVDVAPSHPLEAKAGEDA